MRSRERDLGCSAVTVIFFGCLANGGLVGEEAKALLVEVDIGRDKSLEFQMKLV